MLSNLDTSPATSMTEPLPGPVVGAAAAEVALEVELIAMNCYFNLKVVKAKKYGMHY